MGVSALMIRFLIPLLLLAATAHAQVATYSVSRNHGTYTGSVVTVRESAGSTTAQFKINGSVALVTNDMAETPLADWLNGAAGYATQVWDQSGSGNHATQSDAAKQPRIYEAQINGKAALRFDGVNDWLDMPDGIITLPGVTVIMSVQPVTTTGTRRYLDSASPSRLVLGQDANYFHYIAGSLTFKIWPDSAFPFVMSTRIKDDQSAQSLLNNASQGTGTSTVSGPVNGLCLGAYNQGASNFLDGWFVECKAWDAGLSDADYLTEIRSLEAWSGASEIVKTVIESGTPHCDATDCVDIDGNGLKDILWIGEKGQAYWYEQTSAGVFLKHTIRGTDYGGEVEGCLWHDIDGDGHYEAIAAEQGLPNGSVIGHVRVYRQATPGDPAGTWVEGVIQATRHNMQMLRPIDVDGDAKAEIVYCWEGNNASTGGIHALKHNSGDTVNSTSYTDYQLVQHPGAWWIPDDLKDMNADGRWDLPFTARTAAADRNPNNLQGLFWIEQPASAPLATTWTKRTIDNSAGDWMHVEWGDLCGLGAANDLLAHTLGNSIRIYTATGGWLSPKTPIYSFNEPGGGTLWNVNRLARQVNGRDALLSITSSRILLWHWSGTTWSLITRLPNSFSKWDSRVNRLDVNADGSIDVLGSDSIGDQLAWFSLWFGNAEPPAPPPPPAVLTWGALKTYVESQGVTDSTVIDSVSLDGDHVPAVSLTPTVTVTDGGPLP